MNYKHAYHAGNFADVVKHVVLIALLEAFKRKPAPFCYLDTHAGRGRYDLQGDAAGKTREADDGVLRLLGLPDLPPPLQPYARLVREFNARAGHARIRCYPGSPVFADMLLRESDSAVLCEVQADEAEMLRNAVRHRSTFHVHQRDGYEALRALVPPPEKRGLVLIDPPFEVQGGEFALIQAALADALARWPAARCMVWYPLKLRRHRNPFHRWLRHACPAPWLVGECLVHPDNSGLRLNGCGIGIVNPPWQFRRTLEAILEALHPRLAQGGFSAARIDAGEGMAGAH